MLSVPPSTTRLIEMALRAARDVPPGYRLSEDLRRFEAVGEE